MSLPQSAQIVYTEKQLGKSVSKLLTRSAVSVTLAEVLAKFLAIRKLRPNTVRNYSQITKRCLGDWLNISVTSITKEMIQSKTQRVN